MKKIFILLVIFGVFGCGLFDKVKQTVSGDDKSSKDKSISDEQKKKELDLKERELALKEKELEMQKNQKNDEETLNQSEKELAGGNQDMQNDDERQKYNSSHYRSDELGRYLGDYPEVSARYLTYDDLRGKSKWQLKIMRNEIYARHGYIFQTKEMWNYFSNKSWYYPTNYNVNNLLTSIEKSNISYIKKYE